MDILFWKNLSKDIKIKDTTKLYFKQYLYKLDVYAPGCKSIGSSDIAEDITNRQIVARTYGTGSWWNIRLRNVLAEADVQWLRSLQDTIAEYPGIKTRIEDPKISFYCDSEVQAESLARAIDIDYRHMIRSITGPCSAQAQDLLEKNKVLVKKPPEYRYRVWFKEKQFSQDTMQQIYNYLVQLGDVVKIPDRAHEHLNKVADWIWGVYFYTNDPGIADCVSLIHPDIVREVSEMVCLDNK